MGESLPILGLLPLERHSRQPDLSDLSDRAVVHVVRFCYNFESYQCTIDEG